MGAVTGNELLAETLARLGVKDFFFIMGGPMVEVPGLMVSKGIRAIDVRHEQAAAMMAHAYSRVTGKVGVCLACSGPGALNLLTGMATAWADGAPVVALGGASPSFQDGMGAFQEVDQLSVFRPVSKWAMRLTDPSRIPDTVQEAFVRARSGKPGPVYLDFPADVLYAEVKDKGDIAERDSGVHVPADLLTPRRPAAPAADVARAAEMLAAAERPLIVSGTGIYWGEAWTELRELVELSGVPFYTTPQGRGVIPEDHPLSLIGARSTAFREADLVIVAGTRLNHMLGFGRPPRFAAAAKFVQIDISPEEIGHNRPVDVGLLGDAKVVLKQLADAARPLFKGRARSAWVDRLTAAHVKRSAEQETAASTDQTPIHPLRLAKEVRDVIGRDAILAVDGHEILNFCRQVIPSYQPGHRINSGPFGTMGVGVPFAIGAKVAHPDKLVVVVEGDGSFGMNGMELDTALRLGIPIVCVIGNNGGWTSTKGKEQRTGQWLGHTRYDKMWAALGAHTEYVEDPAQIRPALERAIASGKPALVNVITDPKAKSETVRYSVHESI